MDKSVNLDIVNNYACLHGNRWKKKIIRVMYLYIMNYDIPKPNVCEPNSFTKHYQTTKYFGNIIFGIVAYCYYFILFYFIT